MKQRFFIITWFFLTGTVSADNTIAVFQFNGAIQCQNAAVISPAKAAEELEQAGVKVLEKSVKNNQINLRKSKKFNNKFMLFLNG